MVTCDILDWNCIFVNEIFGSVILTVIGLLIIFLITSGKLRFGFELTIALLVPIAIIASLMIGGFQVVYAFATIIVSLMIAFIFQKIIGNR